jgi:hypothetical protein
MARALAFNCSPRMEKGNTALILNPFIDGMRRAGTDIELLYTKKLKVRPCIGDFRCWGDTPGVCTLHDDMESVLDKMARAETWVFGVPVHAKLPGELQNLFNRTMPLFKPNILVRGRTLIPTRMKHVRVERIALVSTCGWWGLENFDLLVKNLEFMAKIFEAPLARPLLRPDSDRFKRKAAEGDAICAEILKATEEAGAQLVKKGDISKETARRVQVPLSTLEEFLEKNR